MQPETLTLFALRSTTNGEWFQRVSYGGNGTHWGASLAEAKIYSRLSQARARVTFFATRYPDHPPPEIVALHLTRAEVLPEAGRVAKVLEKKRAEKEQAEVREVERRLREAQLDLEAAQARLFVEKMREINSRRSAPLVMKERPRD
jgi:hypothetical protein